MAKVSDSKGQLWVDGQAITLTFTRKTLVTAGSFVNGTVYTILSQPTGNTTDFTVIGSPDNLVGTTFTASFSGADPTTGGGTVTTPASGLAGTEGTLTWTLPVNSTTGRVQTLVYDGILLTSSIKEINASNFPTDSVVYNASPTLADGGIVYLGAFTPGSNYTNGSYVGVPLIGGSGSGATADIVVANGVVTSAVINAPGINYGDGDLLSFSPTIITGGNGFNVNVASARVDKIGNAQVVGAFYNDVETTSLNITGLIPGVPYFFSAHVVSNVITYYTPGVTSYPISEATPGYASDMNKSNGPPLNPTLGQVYFDIDQKLVFVWDSNEWVPTSPSNVLTNNFDPIPGQAGLPVGYPVLGDFFYNTTERKLKCWDGNYWNPVETDSGVPMYNKQGVGTDNTSGARTSMINTLKKMFGWPVVCVELIDEHFNISIDNALQELRHRTDSAYSKQYFFVQIQQFQDVYYLNDASAGTDKIVDVLKIHRLNMLGLVNFAPDNIYAQQFLNQFYAPGVSYDLVSVHLIAAMSETFSLLFAGEVAFNWREATREMRIYKKFGTPEKVLVEASCEKTEQELLTDRWVAQWIQQWAEAEAMMILAHIRGKYATLPGPGGGLTMNAETLHAEAQRLQEDCLRQIMDFEIGQNGPDNFYLPFMIG